MPLELQIIRATEFVRVGAQGHFDLTSSKAALADLVGACHKRGIHQALLDLRDLRLGPTPVFSPSDLVALVNTFPEVGFTKDHRLAILYLSDPHKRARLFAFLSTLHGWSVQAFGSFEDAILWLSRGLDNATKVSRSPAAKTIRVRVKSQKSQAPRHRPAGKRMLVARKGPAFAPRRSADLHSA